MRNAILAAAAALTVAGIGAASAQPAPSPPGSREGGGPGGMMHHPGPDSVPGGMMGRMHHHPPHARRSEPGTFALFWPQADRKLTPPDVQKIAEGFLLWNGNRSWKVVDVAPDSDQAIGFAFATQDGTVIARFKMDPHTGRVTRTG
jgi:hypothetical protein